MVQSRVCFLETCAVLRIRYAPHMLIPLFKINCKILCMVLKDNNFFELILIYCLGLDIINLVLKNVLVAQLDRAMAF